MRLIDADTLDDLICQLNEEGHEITRNEYKMIDNILFEFPTVDAIPISVIKDIKADIEAARYGLINDGLDAALRIIDKYTKGE